MNETFTSGDMRYRHLMAAIDGSDETDQVLAAASDLAQQYGAKLSLLSVVQPVTQVYAGYGMASTAAQSIAFESEAQAYLERSLGTKAESLGVASSDVHVDIGNPAGVIRRRATDLGVDLIVIGTHGRHGLGLLLGATANAVLHGVTCDVLVVRIDKSATTENPTTPTNTTRQTMGSAGQL